MIVAIIKNDHEADRTVVIVIQGETETSVVVVDPVTEVDRKIAAEHQTDIHVDLAVAIENEGLLFICLFIYLIYFFMITCEKET